MLLSFCSPCYTLAKKKKGSTFFSSNTDWSSQTLSVGELDDLKLIMALGLELVKRANGVETKQHSSVFSSEKVNIHEQAA